MTELLSLSGGLDLRGCNEFDYFILLKKNLYDVIGLVYSCAGTCNVYTPAFFAYLNVISMVYTCH
jgi:hypothetical protein